MEDSAAALGCHGTAEQARYGKPTPAPLPHHKPIRSPVAMTEQR